MRKIIFTVLIGSVFGLCNMYGQKTFKDVFRNALAKKDLKDAKEILLAWDYEDRNDPELYPSYFNYYTVKCLEKDSTVYNAVYADSALYFISMGIDQFPTRIDMRIAKIYMLSKLKRFDKLTDETIRLIEQSKKINDNWKGEGFQLIDASKKVMEGAVQNFQEMLFDQKDTTLYKNIRKISTLMIQYYPNYEESWLNLSTLHSMHKEYDKAMEALKKAERINPNNAIVLFNIASIYKIKGDGANARKYFQLTANKADFKTEAKLKQAAEQELKRL